MVWLPCLLLCAVRSLYTSLLLRVTLTGQRSWLPLARLLLLVGLRLGGVVVGRLLVRSRRRMILTLLCCLVVVLLLRLGIFSVLALLMRLPLDVLILHRLSIRAWLLSLPNCSVLMLPILLPRVHSLLRIMPLSLAWNSCLLVVTVWTRVRCRLSVFKLRSSL